MVDDGHKQHQRGSGGSEGWFRSRERSARVDVERRRSTRSDVYHAISADNRKSQLMNSLPPYSLDHRSSVEGDPSTKRQRSAAVTGGLTEGGRNNQASSSSVEGRLRGVSFGGGRLATTKRSLSTERLGAAMAMVRESPIQFMDDDGDEEDSEAEEHLSALALIPVFHHGGRQAAQGGHRSLSALSSPISSIGSGGHRIGTRSCPSTPAMSRRRYLKEGAVQLTSLSTLQTHHRYFFLFNDLLLVSKQKYVFFYVVYQYLLWSQHLVPRELIIIYLFFSNVYSLSIYLFFFLMLFLQNPHYTMQTIAICNSVLFTLSVSIACMQ